MQNATGWDRYRGTPDYFNVCSGTLAGVPINQFSIQDARTGNGYGGFLVYDFTHPLYREWLGIQLNTPMIIGETYIVKLYVNLTINLGLGTPSRTATNKIGVRFSTVSYDFLNTLPLNGYAHVYTNSIITDTLNWIEILGSFIADSAYNHIVIGNFFDNASTSIYTLDSGEVSSYYFVDDISVIRKNATGIDESSSRDFLKVYPNPFNDKLKITSENNKVYSVNIYDLTSRIILKADFSNSVSIDAEWFDEGVYIYEIKCKDELVRIGKVVKQ
jgi:hypothetical protein